MACCAFAVLVVSQLLALLGGLGRRAGHRSGEASNPATAWQLFPAAGAAPTAPPRRRRRWLRRALVLAFAVEIGAGSAALAWNRDDAAVPAAAAAPSTWLCGALGTGAGDGP